MNASGNIGKKIIGIGIFLLFFMLTRYNLEAAEQMKDRILFISSYSYAWETVPEQIKGIQKALGETALLDFQFMDTKNVNTEESDRLFYEKLKYFLQMVSPYDVIIAGDDAAFDFALQYQQELFPDVPIIFEGVNDADAAQEASESPLISGVIESLSYENTIKMAKKLYPEAVRVVGVLDDTETGSGEREEFYKYAETFPEMEFSEINASKLSQEELLRKVRSLGRESILIYIVCSEDGDGNIYAYEEAVHMITDAANIPTFSIVSIGMGRGFLGGEIVSQERMGFIAGEMARERIDGEDPEMITLQEDSARIFCFDENVMKRFGIKRSQLPHDAKIINHQKTFLENHGRIVNIFLVVLAVLLAFIGILIRNNQRVRRMNDEIRQSNERLTYVSRYDSLTALLNRRVFMEDLERKIGANKKFGLIMYDLDGFKNINDVYGHNEGDNVLQELAKRSLGISDEKLTVYRLAGDEFIAIVDDGRLEKVFAYAEALQKTFEKPYRIAGEDLKLCVSIGIALYPKDGATKTEVLASVDKAMYAVKNNGKNGIEAYRDGM